ncbi:hypothetical protein PAPYR_5826 [Paratrimastix pyriformis]|uniref:Uncharacterized protein n=1 Tax=Paratrimastix pyriformis TaxID=342808 RepID=A0ABQ8ULQ8_9EUKA|nr:hypothetical protein PAPYR_5826 [Paratrimastix pyriformis]
MTRLPSDLLVALIRASDCPTMTYIQMLRLSHEIRATIHGTALEISFATDDNLDTPSVPLEALSALIRPCKNLATLSLAHQDISLFAYGPLADCVAWVDDCFAGHRPLNTLGLPVGPMFDALLGAGYLHDLEFMHFGYGLTDPARMTALGHSCPKLESLEQMTLVESNNGDTYRGLAPLARTLNQFALSCSKTIPPDLVAFLGSCAHLERLAITAQPPKSLLCAIGPQLTHLDIYGGSDEKAFDLAELGITRLVSLKLYMYPFDLDRLVAANQATMRSLSLSFCSKASIDLIQLAPSLQDFQLLKIMPHPDPVRIASRNLRRLLLYCAWLGPGATLTLACPALEVLELPSFTDFTVPNLVDMTCPRLRRLRGPFLNQLGKNEAALGWMCTFLHRGLPACLTKLSRFSVTRPETLAALLALPALTRLSIRLGPLARFSNPLVMRTPPSLERLEIQPSTDPIGPPANLDLRIEGPRLRVLAVGGNGAESMSSFKGDQIRLVLDCPALACLRLAGPPQVVSLAVAEGRAAATPPLQEFIMDGCDHFSDASLVAFLTQCGSHLRHAQLQFPDPQDWPGVAAVLGQLPALTHLSVYLVLPSPDLALACPHLRRMFLSLEGETTCLRSLALDCPLLEELSICAQCWEPDARFTMAAPAPHLRLIRVTHGRIQEELERQYPGRAKSPIRKRRFNREGD